MKRSRTVAQRPQCRTGRKSAPPNPPLAPHLPYRRNAGPNRGRSARPPAPRRARGLARDLDRPLGISRGAAGARGDELDVGAVHIQLCVILAFAPCLFFRCALVLNRF